MQLKSMRTYLDFRKHLFANVDDAAEWHLAIYSLLSDSFLSSTWEQGHGKEAVSTYSLRSTYWERKSNLGREYSAKNRRASSNSRDPGE